ncbi:hypothetical protein [Nostoc sp. CCY 9925]
MEPKNLSTVTPLPMVDQLIAVVKKEKNPSQLGQTLGDYKLYPM